jgi:hypothetical protein
MKMIDQWREPMRVPIEKSMGPLDSSARGMPFYPTRPAQTWQMFEVTLKPKSTPKPQATQPAAKPLAATQPAAIPATQPAAAPATQPAPPTQPPTTQPATQPAGNAGGPGA